MAPSALLTASGLLALALSSSAAGTVHVLYQPNSQKCLAASSESDASPVFAVACDPKAPTHQWTALVPSYAALPNHFNLQNEAGYCLSNTLKQVICAPNNEQLWSLSRAGGIQDFQGSFLSTTPKAADTLELVPECDPSVSLLCTWDLRVPVPEAPKFSYIQKYQTQECLGALIQGDVATLACDVEKDPSQRFLRQDLTGAYSRWKKFVNTDTGDCLTRSEGPDSEAQTVEMKPCALESDTKHVLQLWETTSGAMTNSNGKFICAQTDETPVRLAATKDQEFVPAECTWRFVYVRP